MGDMAMRVELYGGAADGAQVLLVEPIPLTLHMPLEVSLVDRGTPVCELAACQVDGPMYRLEVAGNGEPVRHQVRGVSGTVVRYRATVAHKPRTDA